MRFSTVPPRSSNNNQARATLMGFAPTGLKHRDSMGL